MMKITNLKNYLGFMGAATAAALVVGAAPTSASAQGYYDDSNNAPYEMGGVTVYAPRHLERDGATGAPYERVSVSRVVNYSDLDPSQARDHRIIHWRVQRAAEDACGQIDRAYPDTTDNDPPCVRSAVRRAMYEVDNGY